MSSIDERVVEMKFNNSQFQKGVSDTQKSLGDLKKGLNLDASAKSLAGLNAEGSRFSLAGIASGVDTMASKFNALTVVGVTALATIANKAVNAGLQLAKSLTIAPIAEGYNDYTAKLTSVQTIMNATGSSIEKVSTYFGELDTYADKTIYNLTDMTGAFAKFTNAGVDMDKSVPAIKGIANMVALAGQDAGAASIAMYNLSQSIAGGFLTTTDYKSLNLANVATKEWKNQMIEGAVAAGTLKKSTDGMYVVEGSGKAYSDAALFNEALSEGWASAEILTTVLGDYGDTTTEIGAKAQAAAQDVKSWGMMMETLSASVGTGWTDTFELLLGNITESKALFTPLTNTISGFLDQMSEARNVPLGDWNELGGREVAIDAIKNAFAALMTIMKPIREAFSEIFPAVTGKQIFAITEAIRDFTATMGLSGEQGQDLKSTFKGVFAVLDIGRMVIFGLFGMVGKLINQIAGGTGGVLNFTGGIGDFLVSVRDAIKEGDGLTKFFEILGNVIMAPLALLGGLGTLIGSVFSGAQNIDLSGFEGTFEKLGDMADGLKSRFMSFGSLGNSISIGWSKAKKVFDGIAKFFQPFIGLIGDALSGVGDTISKAFGASTFEGALGIINTGLLGGIILLVRKFFKDGFGGEDLGGGMKDKIKEILGGITGSLEAMQANLKAEALLKIAGAIALLTASAIGLSLIDAASLTKALTAMTVMFTQLGASMALFEKYAVGPGLAKMPLVAASMILLGVAINILAIAVGQLSGYSWEELAKGLSAVTALMGIMVGVSRTLQKNAPGMISAGFAMIAMSAGLLVMAKAVGKFAEMEWADMAKGLAGAAGGLAILAGAMQIMPKGMVLQAAGLVIVSAALLILAQALSQMGEMSWGEFAVAMATLAGSLALIAGGLYLMTGALPGAAALVVASAALLILGSALSTMGGMSWEDVGKAMVVLAGSLILLAAGLTAMAVSLPGAAALTVAAAALLILAPALSSFAEMSWGEIAKAMALLAGTMIILSLGLTAMIAALPGAAALIIAAGALAILAPVLLAFGEMSWGEIGKGLALLASVLAILAIAGVLLIPALPGLLGLGAAILLIGIGTLAAGAGILAFSIGFTALAVSLTVAGAAITVVVQSIIALIPYALQQLGIGIVLFAQVIAAGGPAFVAAITTVLLSLITAITTLTPLIVSTLVNLVLLLVRTLVDNVPKLVDSGLRLLTGILNGIANNIGKIVKAGADIIVNFLDGIANELPRVIESGISLIVSFVQGLADGIRDNQERMTSAGKDLAMAIVDGMTGGLASGASKAIEAAKNLATDALSKAKDVLGINSPSKEFFKVGSWSAIGMANGLDKLGSRVVTAAGGLGSSAIDTMKSSMSRLSSMLDNTMDASPTIRPVLDLSDVEKGAGALDGMLGTPELSASTTAAAASAAAYERAATQGQIEAKTAVASESSSGDTTFQQNIYSPKALSPTEVYRQTKNLINSKGGDPK